MLTPLYSHFVIQDIQLVCNATEKIGAPKELNITNGIAALTPLVSPTTPSVRMSVSKTLASLQARPVAALQVPPNLESRTIFPLEGLRPLLPNWAIRARVLRKGDIRTYLKRNVEGKVLSIILMDQSGSIRATAFGQQADEVYSKIQLGRVYFVAKAKIDLLKKSFPGVQSKYELIFNERTIIEEVYIYDIQVGDRHLKLTDVRTVVS